MNTLHTGALKRAAERAFHLRSRIFTFILRDCENTLTQRASGAQALPP